MSEQGQVLAGRYRLQHHIGSGAMGVVWRATDERLHRTVAVKQLLLPPGHDPKRADEARERSMREGRIAARLDHPNSIAIHDVVEDNGQPLLVMEYLPARSLATVLAERGPLSPVQAATMGAQVAAALAAAHESGIIHRDVKPANVLLGDDGTVKITDFGISRAVGDAAVTQTGMVAGTPAYFSPEVARGDEPLLASDVFSLGATLYEAVEGVPPFGVSDNSIALLHAVAAGKFPRPQQAGPLTTLLARMMRINAAERPAMGEVARGLQAVVDGHPPPGPVEAWGQPADTTAATRVTFRPQVGGSHGTRIDPAPQPRRRRPSRRVLYTVCALLIALLAGVVVVAQLVGNSGNRAAPPPPPPPVDSAELERVVSDYYALLPDHPDNAWNRLGPALQAQDRTRYKSYWSAITRVSVIVPPRTTAQNTVSVGIELALRDGSRVREVHRLGMLIRDRTPLINSDAITQTQRIPPAAATSSSRPKPDEDDREQARREREERRKDDDKKGNG